MPDTPIRDTDDQARELARKLLSDARHGALAVLLDRAPFVSRIALAPDNGSLLTLISDLAPHTAALRTSPDASLMIGEPGRGDPLAHPRMTLSVAAEFIVKATGTDAYLAHQPKAKLYIGFGDFHLVRLTLLGAQLNGGFGKAYVLNPSDLTG